MSIKKYLISGISMLLVFGVVTACGGETDGASDEGMEEVVNVYSARHYDIDEKIYADFTEKTGIKVNVIAGQAPEILGRLKSEGADTQADLFITADIANLYQAVDADMIIPIESDLIDETIPARLRGENNEWVALTQRARIIAYDNQKVDPSTLSTYYALTGDEFSGKILIRSSGSTYNQSLLASIIAETSEEDAKEWAAGIVANMAREPKGNDRDQVKAVAAGEGEIAILNTYYVGRMLNSDDEEEVKAAEAITVFFPENTQMNISGAAVIKYSKNQENAITLLEYLISPEVQTLYTDENYEYPVNPNVEPNETLKSFGDYTLQDVSLTDVGKNNRKATEIFGQVGWK